MSSVTFLVLAPDEVKARNGGGRDGTDDDGEAADMLLLAATRESETFVVRTLRAGIREGVEIQDEFVRQVIRESGADDPTLDQAERDKRLRPYASRVVEWSLQEIAREAADRGVPAVWVYIPTTTQSEEVVQQGFTEDSKIAEAAGFRTLRADAYGGPDAKDLWVAPWDNHGNAEAHRRIAVSLSERLLETLPPTVRGE